jgi:predicted Rossmann fold flavoprotein
VRALLKLYGKAEQFLYAPFARFGVQDTFDFYTSRGLPLVVEDSKRAFPHTHDARDVMRVLKEYMQAHGVHIEARTNVLGIEMSKGKVSGIKTNRGVFRAQSYVFATGGVSHAETGSTGEGFSWLYEMGHKTHDANPNLVPLVVREGWVKRASGTVLQNVRIRFKNAHGMITKRGNVLVTHFGLSGPLVLNSAYEVKQLLAHEPVQVTIDLLPLEEVGHVRARFQMLAEAHGNKTLANALHEWFPRGVVTAILHNFDEEVREQKMHSLSRDVRHAVVDALKRITLTVTGTKGFDWAVVSDGGVDLREVDMRTMRSKIHDNVYVVGDMLHIQRPSGGYSLQLCWTTGYVAGSSVGECV